MSYCTHCGKLLGLSDARVQTMHEECKSGYRLTFCTKCGQELAALDRAAGRTVHLGCLPLIEAEKERKKLENKEKEAQRQREEQEKEAQRVAQEREERGKLYGFASIIGQRQVLEKLQAFITLNKAHGRPPGHILLVGPDGMGKRTVARAYAAEQRVSLIERAEASLRVAMGALANLNEGDDLLFSNIGSINRSTEVLLPAMKRYGVDLMVDKGKLAKNINVPVKSFTLIGTCRFENDCSPELLEAFHLVLKLQPYSEEQLKGVCTSLAQAAGISITPGAAEMIVTRSRGNPHKVEVLLNKVAATCGGEVNEEYISQVLTVLGETQNHDSTGGSGSFDALSGIDFEKLITGLLERMGFRTEMTKASGDGGIDIVASLDRPIVGGRYLIQCKRYAPGSPVGAATVREFYGALIADRAAIKGILITTSGFTGQAQEFARQLPIELIGREQLDTLLFQYGFTSTDDKPKLLSAPG